MSDSSGFWAGVIFAGVIGTIAYYNKPLSPPTPLSAPTPEIGRYQIITHQNNAYRDFLLDTATGQTWAYVRVTGVNDKDLSQIWQLQTKFDTRGEEIQYLLNLWEADKPANKK